MVKKYISIDKDKSAEEIIVSEIKRLILGSLSLVSALAWNSAFQEFFKSYKTWKNMERYGPWIYAIIVTLFSIGIIYFIQISPLSKKTQTLVEKNSDINK